MVNNSSSQSALPEGSDPSTAPSDRIEKTSPTPEQFTQTSRCDTTFRESNPLIKSIDFLSSEIQENHNGKPNIIQISEIMSNMRKVDLACDAIESFEYLQDSIQLSDPSNIQHLYIRRLQVDIERQDYYDEYANSDDESIDSIIVTKMRRLRKQRRMAATDLSLKSVQSYQHKYI